MNGAGGFDAEQVKRPAEDEGIGLGGARAGEVTTTVDEAVNPEGSSRARGSSPNCYDRETMAPRPQRLHSPRVG